MMEHRRPEEEKEIFLNKKKKLKQLNITEIKNLFEHEEDNNFYKPVRVSNSWSNYYIEYKSNEIKQDQLKNILIK